MASIGRVLSVPSSSHLLSQKIHRGHTRLPSSLKLVLLNARSIENNPSLPNALLLGLPNLVSEVGLGSLIHDLIVDLEIVLACIIE